MAHILSKGVVVGSIVQVRPLREIGNDNAVANATVAITPRKQNPQTKEWEDGETQWVPVVFWGNLARKAVESFNIGDRVILYGDYKMKPGNTDRNTGREYPPRLEFVAEFGGLEIGRHAATSSREPNRLTEAKGGPASGSANNNGGNGGNNRPAQKPAPQQNQNNNTSSNDDADEFNFSDDINDEDLF